MPDITMCTGGTCQWREQCYRFTATPSEHRQSYFVTPPVKKVRVPVHGPDYCAYYMPTAADEVGRG